MTLQTIRVLTFIGNRKLSLSNDCATFIFFLHASLLKHNTRMCLYIKAPANKHLGEQCLFYLFFFF